MNPLPKSAPASAYLAACGAQLWLWFRVLVAVVAVPVALGYLYACFYL